MNVYGHTFFFVLLLDSTLLDSILLDSFVGQLGSGIGCTLQISQETLDFNICLILTLEIQD